MNDMPKAAKLKADPAKLCSRAAEGEAMAADGSAQAVTWQVPEEVPVAIQYNSEPYTVMMATPADLRDFAVGFSLAEAILKDAADIKGVLVMPVENGMTVDVAVADGGLDKTKLVRRTMEGRSGCGLCGIEDIADAIKPLHPVAHHFAPSVEAILKAAKALPAMQPMNRFNHTVHAAAWVSPDGEIQIVREDVGRHNALDKLIGALALSKTDTARGFVLMSSRCSYELVQKAAIAGLPALITVSAPTALALDLAKKAKIFLGCLGGGGVVVFNR